MDQNRVGNFISECRKQRQMTQSDLARALNVSVQAVSKWERGRNYPDIGLLPKLAELLGINVSELINGEKNTQPLHPEETVSSLIDYTQVVRKKQTKKQILLFFILMLGVNLIFGYPVARISELRDFPYEWTELTQEESSLYPEVEAVFPGFIASYAACAQPKSFNVFFETTQKTFFGAQKEPESLVVLFGALAEEDAWVAEADPWCPLELEFNRHFKMTLMTNTTPGYRSQSTALKTETMKISLEDDPDREVVLRYTIYDLSKYVDADQLEIYTQFSLSLNGYAIHGMTPVMMMAPVQPTYEKKQIPQDYIDQGESQMTALAQALLQASVLSDKLESTKANFYNAYLEYAGDYPYQERREVVYESRQWVMKQIMDSKDTVVTFTTDLAGQPLSVEIRRGENSHSMGGIAYTLQTLMFQRLSLWPFPKGHAEEIMFNLTENKEPWILKLDESGMTVVCTEYLTHYLIQWPQ